MNFLLLFSNFLWLFRFKNHKFGFVVILSFLIFLQAIFAIFAQFFGFFNYSFVFGFNVIIAFLSIVFNFRFIKEIDFKGAAKKIPWIFLAAITIIFIQFYFVHFNYSGKIATYSGVAEVENFKSNQPYFSDEWIAVLISEKIIETGKLPFFNPLDNGRFENFLFVFHSLIAQLDLFFNFNLINQYSYLSIFFSLTLISFIYILLRNLNISVGVSVFTIFLISYLPNSSNLPILWYLLPWNIGFIFLVAFFIFVSYKKYWLAFFANIISILFYPPILVFSIPSFISVSLFHVQKRKIIFFSTYILSILLGLFVAIALVSFGNNINFQNTLETVYNFLIRPLQSYYGTPPDFNIWNIFPIFTIPFIFIGFIHFFREKNYINLTFLIGCVLWISYKLNLYTFLIDYHRTVAITSLLGLIIFAFSLDKFIFILSKYNRHINDNDFKKTILISLLIVYFLMSFSFTKREDWEKFTTLNNIPNPPASSYLIKDDIDLFKNIKNEKFLAPPWKGLVLAVATNNFPVISKSSTLTMNLINYNYFIKSSCLTKNVLLKKFKVNYVYIPDENGCLNWKNLGKSMEGLHLYLIE